MQTNGAEAVVSFQARAEAVQSFIMHHVADSHTVRIAGRSFDLPGSLSFHGLMVLLGAFLLILLFGVAYRKTDDPPRGLTNLLELFVVFIRDQIAVKHLGPEDGLAMTPLFCSVFFFILALNLIGLVPCFYSATSNLSVTAAMAVVSLAVMTAGAMRKHGVIGFVRGFIPHGVPVPVLFLLVPIEMVGLLIKAFALTIRLFANELAGHIVIFFMLGLIVIFGAPALPFFVLGVAVFLLEVGVAFLQAYIFTLLSAVFIGQRYHPEH
jgi:F-type H+-transporting ATPase subunit a